MSEKKTNVTPRSKVQSIGLFLNKHSARIALTLTAIMALTCAVVFADFADEAQTQANTLWKEIATLIQTWCTRLGAVVMLIGGIMFGLGWQQEDSSRKTAGISTIVAGAIVIAVAALTGTFMA